MESLLNYLLKENVKQDGVEKTFLTGAQESPTEVPFLSKYCAAGLFVEFLDNLQQLFLNVESYHNIPRPSCHTRSKAF
ncbi:hypothetical protein DPMN_060733 [Dreissena polymorpha]|uniref:Uncharacterized protein n=1 Tax=Dreissena polymorpha TaxID=45954 RepID=A0A9D4C6A5_DREPO|nr:hypothetical protein DPMN_060733 [Dreissena polymorpha]